ncbi:MAG: hypothetical protein GAK34_03890 [Delftia tsuruhatensis]|nr:MAG: hypothetical protein GAK34_03890 [Delftia tsuruhatensis]
MRSSPRRPDRLMVARRPKLSAPPPVSLATGASSHRPAMRPPPRSSLARMPMRLARLPEGDSAQVLCRAERAGPVSQDSLRTL